MTLASHYSRFKVSERLLFTGHSHQAWPDVAAPAMQAAFDDAAEYVDEKWERAFVKAERVRAGFRALLGDDTGRISLMQNTQDALVRFLSALPLHKRPHLLTTDGEFHTIRLQLARLAQEGIEVSSVPVAQLVDGLRPNTAAMFVSTVSFTSGLILQDLGALQDACDRNGTVLFLDTYHHLNVAPFSMRGIERAFVTGGGYKYCQLGEGNCFLRWPADTPMRPVITGWYGAFFSKDDHFGGATYDPVSHYRAAAVLDFFAAQGLTIERLRSISQAQTAKIANAVDSLGLDRVRAPHDHIAGFIAVRTPDASAWVTALRARGVHTDARGDILRFGPAPYVSDAQIDAAMGHLADVCSR